MQGNTKTQSIPWHCLRVTAVGEKIVSTPRGLTHTEALKRLKKYGENRVYIQGRKNALGILARQCKSILVVILVIAAVLSFFLNDYIDGYVISLAVLANVLLGFWQEWQAERAMAELTLLLSWDATVLRDHVQRATPIEYVAYGDVVVLRAGEKVPADIRLIHADNLEVDESVLTGESLPVSKKIGVVKDHDIPLADRSNMVYMGTLVVRGSGLGYAVALGKNTAMGEIQALVHEYREGPTPLQQKVERLGRMMGIAVLIIACIIFLFGLERGVGMWDMFKTAVALAVSAVPEGLLIAVTIVLAFGAKDLLKKKALVRRLISAETLGATTVICIDKTGTLTEGKLRLDHIVTFGHDISSIAHHAVTLPHKGNEELVWALRVGMLCNDAAYVALDARKDTRDMIGDPVDKALLFAGEDAGLHKDILEKTFPRIGTIPFEEAERYMATMHRYGQRTMVLIKGAPEVVIGAATHMHSGTTTKALSEKEKEIFMDKAQELSTQGLKVLACGYAYSSATSLKGWKLEGITLLGLFALKDPLRPEAKHALALARNARIHTIMLTGDHPLTAQAIVKELGLSAKQGQIKEEKDLDNMVLDGVTVFARMTPKDKLRIVDRLKADGEVVAMTGDGVNDVPALKAADIGIALGSSSHAAKDVSDIVLLEDDFNIIVDVIAQGRKIIEHIRTIVFYLFSHGFGEVLVIIFSIILNTPLALLPVQILWINLATDSLPHLALAKEPLDSKALWNLKPEKRNAPLFKRNHIISLALMSVFLALATFGIFYIMLGVTGDVDKARTMAFAFLGLDALFSVFSLRQLGHTIFCGSPLRNPYLLGAVGVGVLLQVSAVHLPLLQEALSTVSLSLYEWLILAMVVVWRITGIELIKKIFLTSRV